MSELEVIQKQTESNLDAAYDFFGPDEYSNCIEPDGMAKCGVCAYYHLHPFVEAAMGLPETMEASLEESLEGKLVCIGHEPVQYVPCECTLCMDY